MKVLQLSVHFPPNIGGVETHLGDLITLLVNKKWQVFVLCYQPLSAKVPWRVFENAQNLQILRIPWLAGLFYKFIPYPKLEFLYLFPGLFIFTPFILLINNPEIIHAHGLVAGFVAIFWGKLFQKKVIVSTHSIYLFPKSGFYKQFAQFIFGNANKVLCLSKQSFDEIKSLGVNQSKIANFTYWIDLDKFKRNIQARSNFNWKEQFTVLFVGRLVSEKGIEILLESFKGWDKRIGLVFVGTGPWEDRIIKFSAKNPNLHFLGKAKQEDLANIYSAVDVLIVPSVSEEGFGRVIMESLACGTPVIAANRGAISEAMDKTVGRLIDINPQSIKFAAEEFFKNPHKLKTLSKNARMFVQRRYSEKNGQSIIKAYTK